MMKGLTIGWEYLTGYAVATDPGDRQRVECPPHPARVFMALAAAWFETGEDSDEQKALEWLESLDDQPELRLPSRGAEFERSRVTVYVPVNDKAGPAAATLQSAPAMTRSKQPRSFPRIWVGSEPCHLHWPSASGEKRLRDALDRLCGKVTRIGHSSSLVRMWVDDSEESTGKTSERWLPDAGLAEVQVRQTSRGMLDMLADRYGAATRRRHAELTDRIASLKAEKKAITGKGAKDRKAAMDDAIDDLAQELVITIARPPVRPVIGLWSGYQRTNDNRVESDARHTHFDTDLLVLKHVAGPRLPVVSTLFVTQTLRSTLMNGRDVPAWVSGHQPDGTPLRDEDGHLAVIPLPSVGHKHADGHLLGVGLVFPRNVGRQERGQMLGSLLLEKNGEAKQIELKLGGLGVWTVKKRHWSDGAYALQPETWTEQPKGCDNTWASVTPVVLDRFPQARPPERTGRLERRGGRDPSSGVRADRSSGTHRPGHRHHELAPGQPALGGQTPTAS